MKEVWKQRKGSWNGRQCLGTHPRQLLIPKVGFLVCLFDGVGLLRKFSWFAFMGMVQGAWQRALAYRARCGMHCSWMLEIFWSSQTSLFGMLWDHPLGAGPGRKLLGRGKNWEPELGEIWAPSPSFWAYCILRVCYNLCSVNGLRRIWHLQNRNKVGRPLRSLNFWKNKL